MDQKWMHHPAMKNIDSRKLALLVDLAAQSRGLSSDKALPLLVSTNAKMKSLGISFTPQESDLLVDIISADMNPEEKKKLELIKNMIAKNKR